MEMRYITFTILLSITFFQTIAASKNAETPKVVTTFLNNLEKLQQLSDNDALEAYKLQENNKRCFLGGTDSGDGISIDNPMEKFYSSELYYLTNRPIKSAALYCQELNRLLYDERTLKLSHEILNTTPLYNLGEDGKEHVYFYSTKIKKTCTYNNTQKIIWQEFEVSISTMKIDRLFGYENDPTINFHIQDIGTDRLPHQGNINPNQTGQNDQHTTPSTQEQQILTENDYLRLASRYYTSKNYYAATSTLLDLTNKYPNNAEAWFQLALITFYKTKWSKTQYSNPRGKAIEFMRRASSVARGDLKKKADRCLEEWEHPWDI